MNSTESCLNLDEKIEGLDGTRAKNAEIIRKAKDKAEGDCSFYVQVL